MPHSYQKNEEGNLIYPKHTTRQCPLLIQQFREKQPNEKEKESDKDEDKEEDDDGFPCQIHIDDFC